MPTDTRNSDAEYMEGKAAARTADALARAAILARSAEAPDAGVSVRDVMPSTIARRTAVGMAETAKRVFTDVVGGMIETTNQIAGGVADAVRESAEAGSSLADFLDKNVADLSFQMPDITDEHIRFVQEMAAAQGVTLDEAAALQALQRAGELIGRPLDAIAAAMPEIGEPETVTGGAVRGIAQFVTGWLGGLKALKGANVLQGGGRGREFLRTALSAAFADATAFDPDDPNLVNLLEQVPELQGPVTEFLATDPADSEAVNRLRNAVEGFALGAPIDAFLAIMRGFRARNAARAAGAGDAPEIAEQARAGFEAERAAASGRDLLLLGDPEKPLVEVRPRERPAAAAQRTMTEGAPDVEPGDLAPPDPTAAARRDKDAGEQLWINFARIDAEDDVKDVLAQMMEMDLPAVEAARGPKATHAATLESAEHVDAFDALMKRRAAGEGAVMTRAEQTAARRLWVASGQRLGELAERAAANPSAGNQFAFRRMLAIHETIQREVLAQRAETARLLDAWKIPAGGDREKLRAIQAVLDQMGGDRVNAMMAERIAVAARLGPQDLANVSEKMAKATTMDAVREAWINGLLSSPKTHLVNVVSNSLVMLQQIQERWTAAQIARFTGTTGVAPGEAAAMTHALVKTLPEAFRLAGKAMATGDAGEALRELGGGADLGALGKTEVRPGAFGGEAFGATGAVGSALDYVGHVFRGFSELLGAEDTFFKSLNYRMEVHAQAVRRATSEGLEGEDYARRVADLTENPPEEIRLEAADQALYATFTNKVGRIGEGAMQLRDKWRGSWLVLPFVRTPVNIAGYSFERMPLIAHRNARFKADMAAGGARRQLALAKVGTGTMLFMWALDMADRGLLTGGLPDDPGERATWNRLGIQPDSIRIGDSWVSLRRIDPFGTIFGTAARLAELHRRFEIEPEEVEDISQMIAAGIYATSDTFINKTYMEGLSSLFEALEQPEIAAPGQVADVIASFFPLTAAVGALDTALDPRQRVALEFQDMVLRRIPVVSQRLALRRNLWGEVPETGMTALEAAFSPARRTVAKSEPIDEAMKEINVAVEGIGRKGSFSTDADGDGRPETVKVRWRDHPEVYDLYRRLAGNELKEPNTGLGLKDYLNEVVTGNLPAAALGRDWRFEDLLPEEDGHFSQGRFIRRVISKYREAARAAILGDPRYEGEPGVAEFRAWWQREWQAERARTIDAMETAL